MEEIIYQGIEPVLYTIGLLGAAIGIVKAGDKYRDIQVQPQVEPEIMDQGVDLDALLREEGLVS